MRAATPVRRGRSEPSKYCPCAASRLERSSHADHHDQAAQTQPPMTSLCTEVKGARAMPQLLTEPVVKQRSVTCHMGSHGVTCHTTLLPQAQPNSPIPTMIHDA